VGTKTQTDEFSALKRVPGTVEMRKRIWFEALNLTRDVERKRPMSRIEFVRAGRCLIETLGLNESYLGYAMVMLNNAFWLEQFFSVDIQRRLLLLPRCLGDLKEVYTAAEQSGYKIHVADGSPIVVKIINEENMDALIGVGCLDSLEKAFDKVRQLGIPSIAVPLNRDGCRNTSVDRDFLTWFLKTIGPSSAVNTRNYLPLLRDTNGIFEAQQLYALLDIDPASIDETARIALDWLLLGGKRLRPFLTLSSYRAFTEDGEFPTALKKLAVAIEIFHKASLVHDDIEDEEECRYGEKTIYRKYGAPVAINIGDYLLGLGYKMVSLDLEASSVPDHAGLLRIFTDAHTKLALGQGMELLMSARRSSRLSLTEVLRCYMLKTSPAFQAAIEAGMIMAGSCSEFKEPVRGFSKHVGAAFQIQNDIDGWESDASHVRPNSLLALALERATDAETMALLSPENTGTAAQIYDRYDVFARANLLVDRLRMRALEITEGPLPEKLKDLLHFLIEMIIK